jgi:uncharacterized protein YjdB
VSFSSSSTSIATVSSSGVVLGISPGNAIITASAGGRSSTAQITVRPRPVGAVIVSPAQSTVSVGQSLSLSVQITDGSGNLLTGRPLEFRSSNVKWRQSRRRHVTATSPGTAIITKRAKEDRPRASRDAVADRDSAMIHRR